MKNLRIQLPDDLYHRLKKLCDHHGQMAHLIRRAIRQLITTEEAKQQEKGDN